jgi:hypothetical protein
MRIFIFIQCLKNGKASGPPILEWSIHDLQQIDFQSKFYSVLKEHIAISLKGIQTRKIGYTELINWKTGEKPAVWSKKFKRIKSEEILDQELAPHLTVFFSSLVMGKDLFTIRSIYKLMETKLEMENHFEVIDGQKRLIEWTAPLAEKFT